MKELQASAISKLVAVVGIALIAVSASAFFFLDSIRSSQPSDQGSTRPGTSVITVVTRHDATIREKSRAAFLASDYAKRHSISDVRMISVAAELWKDYIEGGVDVAWGGGPTIFDNLVKGNTLAPLASTELLSLLQQIPNEIGGVPMKRLDNERRVLWVAAAISTFGFTVNKNLLDQWKIPKPFKWRDLASEALGKSLPVPQLSIADPLRSTSNTRIYEIILQANGWEEGWRVLVLIAANAKVFDSSDAVREAVITGDTAVGVTIDFYGFTAMQRNPVTEYVIPTGESIINGDPIAMTKNAKNKAGAQAFIAWVLTEGQKIWLDLDINRMPVNPAVFDTDEGKKRPDLKRLYQVTLENKGIDFDDDKALMTEISMQYYFKSTLIDANPELKQAWAAVLSLREKAPARYEELKRKLTSVLTFKDPLGGEQISFTEDYAKKIAGKFSDPAFISSITSVWREKARTYFNEIATQAKSSS